MSERRIILYYGRARFQSISTLSCIVVISSSARDHHIESAAVREKRASYDRGESASGRQHRYNII